MCEDFETDTAYCSCFTNCVVAIDIIAMWYSCTHYHNHDSRTDALHNLKPWSNLVAFEYKLQVYVKQGPWEIVSFVC